MTEGKHPRGPVAHFTHKGHVIANVNEEFQKKSSLGQRVADRVAQVVGSWPFIIIQSAVIAAWMAVNSYLLYKGATQPGFFDAWDPYPFILLNLVLSFQAAYTGPVVMMSQNRQSEKDRLMAEHDYHINVKAEEEIAVIMEHLAYQDELLHEMKGQMDALVLAMAKNEPGFGAWTKDRV
ncbi:MAG: DUF1003 domain-containing protein [Negativicutes bacterium]|nr:DUF1003 domain-containing protein [Negativicutes bacterium]